MKRRPLIIAAVVTVAALACVVPWWWDVWLAVAYEPAGPVMFAGNPYPHDPPRLLVHYKRTEWVPGPVVHIPPQTCWLCKKSEHDGCSVAWKMFDEFAGIQLLPLIRSWWDKSEAGEPIGEPTYCTGPTCHPERER